MPKKMLVIVIAAVLTAGAFSFVLAQSRPAPPAGSPVPRVITYEGNLDQNGQPAPDGAYSFAFSFWNDLTATAPANQVGTTISKNGVQVTGGKFIVELAVDDDAVYETSLLYLEITVNSNKLAPRQKINAAMFAVRAETSERVTQISDLMSIGLAYVITVSGQDNVAYSGNPGAGWKTCQCALQSFGAGTCGGNPANWANSYGNLYGFMCSYNSSDGKIHAWFDWSSQAGGCHLLGVFWVCMK